MSLSHSLKRILVVGREVGSITRLLKEKASKVLIGAVDVLGNKETRLYADWKFSVEKQSPNVSIFRFKNRPVLDLLYELTLIMLEDLEFDLLIPLSPFQTRPQYIHRLSREVEVYAPNYRSLGQVSSAHTFLTYVSAKFSDVIPPNVFISDLSKVRLIDFPAIFISKHRTYYFSSETSIFSIGSLNQSGFLFPVSRIHCAFFMAFPHCIRFLGIQTLSNPYNHAFFLDYLEKNALIPFHLPQGFSYQRIISFLSRIITQLEVSGMITIYFGLSEDSIFPVSCNVLPDENFGLWESRSSKTLVPYFFSSKDERDPLVASSNFAFNLPIYSRRPIRVPPLPKDLCYQRNLAKVISHPDYPLCALLQTTSSFSVAYHLLQQKKMEILKILPSKA
ncbi:MAG: hypothetical protein JSU57_06335 [Candidatus Heimdallarchaeota archaeon]|nr:MAG: hypothetical protein JSU57_06335 [Candidatus Heimdallarchaeota archaeon]